MSKNMKNILIQGSPGIGKTTIIKKVISNLQSSITNDIDGFYTEEVRNGTRRIGFDIITLENSRGILARRSEGERSQRRGPTVGAYHVNVNELERLALPALKSAKKFIIIDEIGKMELMSKKFEDGVKNVFNRDNVVLASVPLRSTNVLIENLKKNKNCLLITVNESNRDDLVEEITKTLLDC